MESHLAKVDMCLCLCVSKEQTFLLLSHFSTNNDTDFSKGVEVIFLELDLIKIIGAHNVQTSILSPIPRFYVMAEDDDVLSFKGSYRFTNRVKRCCTATPRQIHKRSVDGMDPVNHPSSFKNSLISSSSLYLSNCPDTIQHTRLKKQIHCNNKVTSVLMFAPHKINFQYPLQSEI